MTLSTIISLEELLDKIQYTEDVDFLRETVRWLIQQLMEAEVTAMIGAKRYERSPDRTTQRNGYRDREIDTRVGTIQVRIPKVRHGKSYYPSWLLERWQPAERALVAVIIQAYVNGVSTRKMDALMKKLGIRGVDKSTVSRITKELDERIAAFRNRSLEGSWPYLWLDATSVKVREGGRVVNMSLVMAIGVRDTGEREVLGFDLGASEDGAFWQQFLRGLVARGLRDVKLVISDAHEGLKEAISVTFAGASWQRCRVHFTRNVLSQVPKSAQQEVADWLRAIFAQPTYQAAWEQLGRTVDILAGRYPKAAALLEEAAEEVLAHMHFPRAHWARLHSTNPLERVNRELKRRLRVVGIFPDRASLLRLAGAVLLEIHEEWIAGRRYFSQESMQAVMAEGKRSSEKDLKAAAG